MLEPVLQQLHWCDEVCIVMNNADKATQDLCYKYGTILHHDDREWGREQWRIKQDFLDKLTKLLHAPHIETWIWCLDADELFDPRFDLAMAHKMMSGKDVAWYFWCFQLWNDPGQVRMDLSFPNVRFYRLMPELGLHFQATALHCGLAPAYAYRFGSQSGLYFRHYGLMKAEDRARKVARYDRYDPGAVYKGKSWYDALRNERARSLPFDEAVAKLPEFIYRNKPVSPKNMAKDRTIYLFTNKHGKVVEAVGERQRDQFAKMGYQPHDELHVSRAPEAEVVPAEEATDEAPVTAATDAEDAGAKASENENDHAPENVGEGAQGGSPAGDAPKRKGTGAARGSAKGSRGARSR